MAEQDAVALQQTLAGGEQLVADVEEIRGRPDTMLWCEDCEEFVLRSRRYEHPHDLVDLNEEDDEEDEERPERVGALYDITISVSVDYRFRIPAYSESQAKERAKDLRFDAKPADSYVVHTDEREVMEIMSTDPKLPDDWDPYGNTRIWEVYGDDE